jgi:hypothetical protein
MLRLIQLEDRTACAALRFAVVGDYGIPGQAADDVAGLIRGWNPDLVLTTGDNNYMVGAADTIEANIGSRYRSFFAPTAAGDPRFLPTLGNHDWETASAQPYLDYFTLPGNERYYSVRRGPVEFFAIDSDPREPDGTSATSVQATWLRTALAASTAPWKVVAFHHPPHTSSGVHAGATQLRWPFREWGASVVLTGHNHHYERLQVDGLTYVVNGAGGAGLYPFAATPEAGSVVRYNGDHGAMRLDATDSTLTMRFETRGGQLIDEFTLTAPTVSPNTTRVAFGAGAGGAPEVVLRDGTGAAVWRRLAYDAAFRGGVQVATGDFNRDGVADVAVAPGRGGGPHVKVFDGTTGQVLTEFFAYNLAFTNGVNLAVGDLDNDGRPELLTAAMAGGGPHVKAFDATGVERFGFFAYPAAFTGGLTVAAADLDGDGRDEIVTGAMAGGGPHVKAFRASDRAEVRSFFAYASTFTGGVFVAAGDLDGDGRDELVIAAGPSGGPHVKVFRPDGSEAGGFFAFDQSFRGGVRVAVTNGLIRTAAGPGGGPHVKGYRWTPFAEVEGEFPFDPAFRGGVFVG